MQRKTTAKKTASSRPAAKKTAAKKTTTTRSRVRPSSKSTVENVQDATAVPQLARVPEKRFATGYINRVVTTAPQKRTEFELFDLAEKNLWNILIEGPTQLGKTAAALAWAASRGKRFYAIPSNVGIDPSQLFGKFVPNPLGGFIWQDGPVTDIVRNGGMLMGNEFNFFPERVSTVLFQLLDLRREITLMDHHGEVIQAHLGTEAVDSNGDAVECWCDLSAKECNSKRVVFVGDMNPGYEGTRPLNKALRARFAIQLAWDYDTEIEKQLVPAESLVTMAEQFREALRLGEYRTPVNTSMLIEFGDIARNLGMEFAQENFVNHFLDNERDSARQVVRTHSINIEQELAALMGVSDDSTTTEDEEEEYTRSDFDGKTFAQVRRTAKNEWGYDDEELDAFDTREDLLDDMFALSDAENFVYEEDDDNA